MRPYMHGKHFQGGSVLLEGLFAILIFSIGILTLTGLQATSVKQSVASKYRSDAAFLANELLGRMWVNNRSPDNLKTLFETGGDEYEAWFASVKDALPGAEAYPPSVQIESTPGGSHAGGPAAIPTTKAKITISWKAPSEPASEPAHKYVVITQIR